MTPRIFFINLDNRPDRRDFMEQQLESTGVDYERFPAIRPSVESLVNTRGEHHHFFRRAMPAVKRAAHDEQKLQSRLGMFGCYISHFMIHQKMMRERRQDYIILEDDCVFKRENLNNLQRMVGDGTIPDDWDIIRNCLKSDKTVQRFSQSHRLSRHAGLRDFHDHFGGTFFCMFRSRSARKILTFMESDRVFAIDAVYSTHMLNSYHLDLGFHHLDFGSDISKPLPKTGFTRRLKKARNHFERITTKLIETKSFRASTPLK